MCTKRDRTLFTFKSGLKKVYEVLISVVFKTYVEMFFRFDFYRCDWWCSKRLSNRRWSLAKSLFEILTIKPHFQNFNQWPTWCTNFFNKFITILYMYMFRAITCSSSGGQIVLIQHLVSSLSLSDRSVHGVHRTVTESDDTRCCINL
jgi:hypothetical protein